MKSITEIKKLASSSRNAAALVAALTEEVNLKDGQEVFCVHGMGQSSVSGKFKGLENGYAKVDTGKGIFTVLPHLVFPKHAGTGK